VRGGLIIDQGCNINMFKVDRRFDRRYVNPNQHIEENLHCASPFNFLKNYENQYGHEGMPDFSLFLDEKFVPKENRFTLVGVMIPSNHISAIVEFMKKYRKVLNPKLFCDDWYIKGDNKHLYKYNVFNVRKEDLLLAKRRWSILGNMLEGLNIEHIFHISTIDTKKYLEGKTNKQRKTATRQIEYDAMINIFKSLDVYKYNNLQIVIDNVDQAIEKNYKKAINDFYGKNSFIEFTVHPKKDFYSINSNMLQYVDIFLFAIERFLYPNFDYKKGQKYNILVDFELYKYKDFYSNFNEFEQKIVTDLFENIKNIYHHIRFHTIQNIEVSKDIEDENTYIVSSAIYKRDGINYNFGRNLVTKIIGFCNLRSSKRFMSDEAYFNINKIN